MVKMGIDCIDEYLDLFEGKKCALITNHTGINKDFISTIDILKPITNLIALLSPEHGIRGELQAGVKFDSYYDDSSKIKVYSLYNDTRRPPREVMEEIDVLAFDIQDVGARFYTFLYTMSYAMEATKDYGKKIVIFDRPNPVNGIDVEGNILDLDNRSFVGYYPIVQRYGLTIGELATLFNQEFNILADLHIIKMEDYSRNMDYFKTGSNWMLPSPNIPTPETAYVYLATCVFEGTNMSEGRGTTKPFHFIGSPYLKQREIIDELEKLNLEGVRFRPVFFTPTFSKHKGQLCKGLEVVITDYQRFKPVITGFIMLDLIRRNHHEFEFLPPYSKNGKPFIDLLTGNSYLRENKYNINQIKEIVMKDTKKFEKIKRRYHLYD